MRIAVIGAGLSGLAAARRVIAQGHDAVVFEKSRGLGGRLATRRTDDGMPLDHGAPALEAPDGTLLPLGALTRPVVVLLGIARPGRVLEALARAFLEQGTPIRLLSSARAMRGHGGVLGRWLETGLPSAPHVVLDGGVALAAQWRSAVLACGARHVTLAAEAGVPDAVAAELADLVASAAGRHVVAR